MLTSIYGQIELVNPLSTQPVPVVLVQQPFTIQMKEETFKSNSSFDLRLLSGPVWVRFDKETRQFIGTPPNSGTFDVVVEAYTATQNAVDHLVLKSVADKLLEAPKLQVQDLVVASINKTLKIDLLTSPMNGFGLRAFANGLSLPPWLKFNGLSGEMSGTPPRDTNLRIDVFTSDSDVRLVKSAPKSFTIKCGNNNPSLELEGVVNNTKVAFSSDFLLLKFHFVDADGDVCNFYKLPSDIVIDGAFIKIPSSYNDKSLDLIVNDGFSNSEPFILLFSQNGKSIESPSNTINSKDKSTLLYTCVAVGCFLLIVLLCYFYKRQQKRKLIKKTAFVDLESVKSIKSVDQKEQIVSMYYDRSSKVSITSYSTNTIMKASQLNEHSNAPINQFTPIFTKVIAKGRPWHYSPIEIDQNSVYNIPQKGIQVDWKIAATDGQFYTSELPKWLSFSDKLCLFSGTPDKESDNMIKMEFRKNGALKSEFKFRIIVSVEKKESLQADRFMDSIFSTTSRQNSLRYSTMNFTEFKQHLGSK